MAAHHTKDKGDLGVAKAYADLVAQGFMVMFPTTEHAPFDLVTYVGGQFSRIQVKYRSARLGAVYVQFKSTWADRNGVHSRPMDKHEIDAMCIYCPDTDQCYYVSPRDFRKSVTLRITPSRNSQSVGVQHARNFRTFNPDGGDQLSLLEETEISRPERLS
jgi:hypothetical protein